MNSPLRASAAGQGAATAFTHQRGQFSPLERELAVLMQESYLADKNKVTTALAMSRKRPKAMPVSPGPAEPNDKKRRQKLVHDLLKQERIEKKEHQRKNSLEKQKEHKKKVVSKILNNFSRKMYEEKNFIQSDDYQRHVQKEEGFRPRTTSVTNGEQPVFLE